MEAVKPSERRAAARGVDGRAARAEPRAGRAGIVDRVLLRRAFRIDAQAAGNAGGLRLRAEAPPLAEGVEDDVVGDGDELRHVLCAVGRGEDVVFLAHFFVAEARLVETARGGAGEVRADERIERIHREAFLREQHMGSRRFLDVFQDGEVLPESREVDDVGGRRHALQPGKGRARHQSTSSGEKLSCQGRPHLLRASMNGSGSNSSMFLTPGPFQVPFMMSIAPIIAGTPVV